MVSSPPARTTFHRVRLRKRRVAGLLVLVAAALVVGLGHQWPASSSPTPLALPRLPSAPSIDALRGGHQGALGRADGAVPDGTSVFDDAVPGVANLDPALLGALRQAAADAENDGVRFTVDSGWRSPAYQEHLRQEALSKYGSEREAARWVATPDTSAHVSGDAVDIGPAAATWLSQRGAGYGLCQTYGNEPWHFELRPSAPNGGCPAMYADPTHDPRMRH